MSTVSAALIDGLRDGLLRLARLGLPAPRTHTPLASGGLIQNPRPIDAGGCIIPAMPPRYGTVMHVGPGGLEPLPNIPLTKPRQLQPPGDRIAEAIRDQRFYRDLHPATPNTFWAGMQHAEQIARGLR